MNGDGSLTIDELRQLVAERDKNTILAFLDSVSVEDVANQLEIWPGDVKNVIDKLKEMV